MRFYQSLGVVNAQSFSTSVVVFTRKLNDINNLQGVGTFACSQNIVKLFLRRGIKHKYYNNPIMHTRSAGFLTQSLSGLKLSESINPGLVLYDELMYPFWVEQATPQY